jgi:hypothetical protein
MKKTLSTLVLAMALFACQKETLQQPAESITAEISSDAVIDILNSLKSSSVHGDATPLATSMIAGTTPGAVIVANSQGERWIYYNWARTWSGVPILNRSAGGSTWNVMYKYIDITITMYNPKVIVLYQGENEYNGYGWRADQINASFIRYFDEVRRQNPQAHIIVLSMMKIPKLASLHADIDKLNGYYKAKALSDANASFEDIASVYPYTNAALWRTDLIHLNDYNPMASVVKPAVINALAAEVDTTQVDTIRPVLFLGSSTIAQWKIDSSYPELKGNWQKVHFSGYTWKNIYDNLKDTIAKIKPRQVVIYSGDNDIVQKISLSTMQTYFQRICREKIWAVDSTIKVTFMYTKPSNPTKAIVYPSGETGWNVIKYFNRNMNNWLQTYHSHHATASADTYSSNLRYGALINEHYKGLNDVHWSKLGYDVNDERVRPLLTK